MCCIIVNFFISGSQGCGTAASERRLWKVCPTSVVGWHKTNICIYIYIYWIINATHSLNKRRYRLRFNGVCGIFIESNNVNAFGAKAVCERHMAMYILVNVSENGLLPEGNKSLTQSMLTYHPNSTMTNLKCHPLLTWTNELMLFPPSIGVR